MRKFLASVSLFLALLLLMSCAHNEKQIQADSVGAKSAATKQTEIKRGKQTSLSQLEDIDCLDVAYIELENSLMDKGPEFRYVSDSEVQMIMHHLKGIELLEYMGEESPYKDEPGLGELISYYYIYLLDGTEIRITRHEGYLESGDGWYTYREPFPRPGNNFISSFGIDKIEDEGERSSDIFRYRVYNGTQLESRLRMSPFIEVLTEDGWKEIINNPYDDFAEYEILGPFYINDEYNPESSYEGSFDLSQCKLSKNELYRFTMFVCTDRGTVVDVSTMITFD